MTCRVKWIKELEFAQCHPQAFQEAHLIGLGEVLQFGSQGPRSHREGVKEGSPDALEERSLRGRIESRHELLQAGAEKAHGAIVVIPGPARQMTECSPVMAEHRRSYAGAWDERFRGPVEGCGPRPLPVDADQGQVMCLGRSVM